MIKYLGSKRLLLPHILSAIEADAPAAPLTVLDLFSGTSRVGHALKARGHRVIANDHNAYAATLARCYVQADADTPGLLADAQRLIDECNALPPRPGYFTDTFCLQARYIHPKNGERIDAIREHIERCAHTPDLHAVLLTSLIEAADRVDSTTGVQMAYLKKWAPRAANDLALRMPNLLPRAPAGRGLALQLDALDAARRAPADVAYIDPPYNQHAYLGNYHVWESLALWDKPPVYGVARKRVDVRTRRSPFNSRPAFADALRRVLLAVRARTLVVSFSNEGFLSAEHLAEILREAAGERGTVTAAHRGDFPRYIGARIGIYNPRGEKVGAVTHVTNQESIFVVRRAHHPDACPAPSASPASGPEPLAHAADPVREAAARPLLAR